MYKKRIKIQCKMCENKMFKKTKDGMCMSCHMSLCQKKAIDCLRCNDVCSKLIDWVYKENKNDSL